MAELQLLVEELEGSNGRLQVRACGSGAMQCACGTHGFLWHAWPAAGALPQVLALRHRLLLPSQLPPALTPSPRGPPLQDHNRQLLAELATTAGSRQRPSPKQQQQPRGAAAAAAGQQPFKPPGRHQARGAQQPGGGSPGGAWGAVALRRSEESPKAG
jgi:hypothetical protein